MIEVCHLKLGIIAPEFLPIWGGVSSHIVELVKSLPKDIDIHVITLDKQIPGTNYILSEEEMKNEFDRELDIHILTKATDSFLYNAKFQYACNKHVPQIVEEYGLDLIHSHFPHMSDLFLKLKGYDMPIITTTHTTLAGQEKGIKESGMGFSQLENAEKYNIVLAPLLKKIEKIYLNKSNNLISVSNWLKDILINEYSLSSDLVNVIPNGVDYNRFVPNVEPCGLVDTPDPIVLFTGRLVSTKGINFLIDAIPKILGKEKAHFVFVGGGNPAPYKQYLEYKGINKSNYSFLGYVEKDSDIVSLYSNASVYVAPTLYENLPIRILEAMSCGIPVVATNVCAIPEAIVHDQNGILIPIKDSDALAEAVISLLADDAYRKKLGQNARQTVLEKFTWEQISKQTFNLYKNVLENK